MFRVILARREQGFRTSPYPLEEPKLPERFRGLPILDSSKCGSGCRACAESCPTDALTVGGPGGMALDLGRCLFCNDCVEACPEGTLAFSSEYRLSTRGRDDLVLKEGEALRLAEELGAASLKLFGRSLKLRQVSAGGCNGCEADLNVLSTIVFDLARFGIQFVASPRHADGIVITGPVTENMRSALQATYDATPAPKLVIAVGACAISGGPYIDNPEQHNGAGSVVPVDLYIPGCPPHPWTILDGLLRLLNRLPSQRAAAIAAEAPPSHAGEDGATPPTPATSP